MTTTSNWFRRVTQRSFLAMLSLVMVLALPGCGVFLVGSAVTTTAIVATDRRTVGEQVTDKEINLKVANEMRVNFGETAHINATSYLGTVLLTGEVFSENISKKAVVLTAAVPQVTKVINQLYVGPLASFGQMANDTWLSSKIRATLIATQGIPSGAIIDVVERDNVYLMGLVTQAEADLITRTVATIGGVKEVFPFFQIMTPEQAKALEERSKINNDLPESNPTPTGTGDAGTVSSSSNASSGSSTSSSAGTSATPIAPASGATPIPINAN